MTTETDRRRLGRAVSGWLDRRVGPWYTVELLGAGAILTLGIIASATGLVR